MLVGRQCLNNILNTKGSAKSDCKIKLQGIFEDYTIEQDHYTKADITKLTVLLDGVTACKQSMKI